MAKATHKDDDLRELDRGEKWFVVARGTPDLLDEVYDDAEKVVKTIEHQSGETEVRILQFDDDEPAQVASRDDRAYGTVYDNYPHALRNAIVRSEGQ